MNLIEKYLGEVIKNQPIPKNIMGIAVKLKKQQKSDMNISYQLYQEKTPSKAGKFDKQKSGFVRQYDVDADQNIETKKFPKFEDAEKYYKKLIRLM